MNSIAIMFSIRDNVFSGKNANSKNIAEKTSYLSKAGSIDTKKISFLLLSTMPLKKCRLEKAVTRFPSPKNGTDIFTSYRSSIL